MALCVIKGLGPKHDIEKRVSLLDGLIMAALLSRDVTGTSNSHSARITSKIPCRQLTHSSLFPSYRVTEIVHFLEGRTA